MANLYNPPPHFLCHYYYLIHIHFYLYLILYPPPLYIIPVKNKTGSAIVYETCLDF